MTTNELFSTLLSNLVIQDINTISNRYKNITKILNKYYTTGDSDIENSLQVGSFGRGTAIEGLSDLDMVYILPDDKWSDYTGEEGASKLLNEIKSICKNHYSTTEIHIDQCIVSLNFTDFDFELQPVFNDENGDFKFPDTYAKYFKFTKPRKEQEALNELNNQYNKNVKKFCKLLRAWKNNCGVNIGGLLIDTLVYKFFTLNPQYKSSTESNFDEISERIFDFLQNEPKDQKYYLAPGSNQQVYVKGAFQKKAKRAYRNILEARKNTLDSISFWKDVYGKAVPSDISKSLQEGRENFSIKYTEQFIEDIHPIHIKYNLLIDCEVKQDGYRQHWLRDMIAKHIPLLVHKQLSFRIVENNVPKPYTVKWKVLNRGSEAISRNMIRGTIVNDDGYEKRTEHTDFRGNHIVECYIVKNEVVVARDSILVPIRNY